MPVPRLSTPKSNALVLLNVLSRSPKLLIETQHPPPLTSLLPNNANPCNTLINTIVSDLLTSSDTNISIKPPESLIPFLSPAVVSAILLRSQSHPLQSLHFLDSLPTSPLPPHFSIILHSLSAAHLYVHATLLLLRFIRLHPAVDHFYYLRLPHPQCICCEATFSLLVKSYVKTKRLKDAYVTLKKLVAYGVVPDAYTFNGVLSALVRERRFEECWEVYGMMGSVGVPMNTFTFNILIHALCSAEDVGRAVGFLDEMEEKGFEPDVVTYNTLLDGYCKRGMMNEAFNLFGIMPLRGLKPNLLSYTVIMGGLCRAGRTAEAHCMRDQMERAGFSADAFVYNLLVSGYCREGLVREARSLFLEMIGRGYVHDEGTCHLVVEAFVQAGKLLACLELLSVIRKRHVAIPAKIYDSLIAALCGDKRPRDARSVLLWGLEDQHSLSLQAFNEIIDCFCQCDSLQDALDLEEEMVKQDIKPNAETYHILISCLCRIGNILAGESLMRKMVSSGLRPGAAICASLVEGWCKQGNLCKAESTLEYFLREFQVYSIEGYNALMRAQCEVADPNQSFELHDRMLNLGYLPSSLTCRSLIQVLSRSHSIGG